MPVLESDGDKGVSLIYTCPFKIRGHVDSQISFTNARRCLSGGYDVEPLLHKIYYFDDVVNEAQSLVMSAFSDLEESIEESIIFKDVDLTSEISISNAFEEMGRPDEYEFAERLEKEFSIEKFERFPARSV